MPQARPEVSVVIATHNRPARLARLLEALGEQTLPRDAYEVIVVDDGSEPPAALPPDHGVRLLRHEHPRGPAAARNTGWRAAKSNLIAFTDDDCRPAPRWLAAGLRAHREHPGAMVQGCTVPDPEEASVRGALTRSVTATTLGPQYEACNMFYPRAVLERLGGFDEGYGPRLGGEDSDLAWRALEARVPAVLASDALVHHAVHRLSLGQMVRDASRWQGVARLVARHPGARAMLDRRVFLNGWHYALLRTLLALGLPLPRALRFVLVGRQAQLLLGRARAAGDRPGAAAYLLLLDLVEMTALARGAIRYRTPIL